MPFAGYDSFEECVNDHEGEVSDAQAYCAQIHKEATGEYPSQSGAFDSIDEHLSAVVSGVLTQFADDVMLTYGVGGEAHTDADQYESFCEDIADAGGVLVDIKGAQNDATRVYPPDIPDAHDPRIGVYGLDADEVQTILDRYEDVRFDDVVED